MKNSPLYLSLARVALATGVLLLIPFIAMQFTSEVQWSAGDFVMGGALLFSAGTAIILAIRHIPRPAPQGIVVAAIVLAFALVWAELAVGLFH